jgi:tRNA(fMet)-specific endonuclease VapC
VTYRKKRIESKFLPDLPVLSFDTAAGGVGELRAKLEREGPPIGDAGMHIAAIAPARGLTVATANERRFRRVPRLEVENWLRE